MRWKKTEFARAFTMIELLMVISIIGLLAGMLLGMSSLASTKMKSHRIKGELSQIVTAIDFYKATYKVYPPDNRLGDSHNISCTATNQLFLELSGCLVTNLGFTSPHIRTRSGAEANLKSAQMKVLFGDVSDGILNASERSSKVKDFLSGYPSKRLGKLTNSSGDIVFDILRVPAEPPLYNAAQGTQKLWRKLGNGCNPWHYNSSNPTNNPGKYDLWAEFQLKKQNFIKQDENGRHYIEYYVIGNWNDMKPEIRKEYL